jgi:hypothetical protein
MARSARCDVRWRAAAFVGPDETTIHENSSVPDGFRRLLLQIGGANIAPRGSRFVAAYFVVARGRKACPLTPSQHGGFSARRRAIRLSGLAPSHAVDSRRRQPQLDRNLVTDPWRPFLARQEDLA